MDMRMALILLAAIVFAAIAAGLCRADGRSWPTALLAAGVAAGGTIAATTLLL